MKKNIISSTNALMRQLVGLTGHAESFAPKKFTKIKPFNSERYMNAFTALQTDAAVAKAEMFEMKVFILERKAMGEADATILGKVKTGATDLWRKVKELIGKLIILAEEFFRGLFDKTKKAEKVAKAAEEIGKKLLYLEKNADKGNLEIEEVKVRISKSLFTDAENRKKKLNLNDPNTDIENLNKIFAAENKHEENMTAAAATASFWLKFLKQKTKDTVVKDIFKELKEKAKEVRKTGQFQQATIKNDKTGDGILKYTKNIEEGNLKLKRIKESLAKYSKKSDYEEFNISDKTSLKKFISIVQASRIWLNEYIELGKENAKNIKELKLVLNKVKNAPTKVTGTTDPKVLQIIRTYCTRMSSSMNLVRSIHNISLSKAILDVTEAISAAKEVLGMVESEAKESEDLDGIITSSRHSL